MGLLNYWIQHNQRDEIKEISLYCYQHLAKAVEVFSKNMDNLLISKLYLRGMNIDDTIFSEVSSQSAFKKIQKLGLSYNSDITDETVLNIVNTHPELAIKILELDSTGLTNGGVRTIAFSKSFKNIKELDLTELNITNQAVLYLSNTQAKQKLKQLKLKSTQIDEQILPFFGACSRFSHLKTLELSHLEIHNLRNFYLFCNRTTHSFQLKRLTLKSCDLKLEHINLICHAKTLTRLEYLDLSDNGLNDKVFIHFFKAKFQTTLKHLILARNHLTYKFLESLSKSKCYPNLETLDLTYCPTLRNIRSLTIRKRIPFKILYLGKVQSNQREFENIITAHFWGLEKLKLNTAVGVIDWNFILRDLSGVSRLKVLKLNNLMIGNKAIKTLFTRVQFPNLEQFKLSGKSHFDQETLNAICFTQFLSKLETLSLKHNLISDIEIAGIKDTNESSVFKGFKFEQQSECDFRMCQIYHGK